MTKLFFVPEGTEIQADQETNIKIQKIKDDGSIEAKIGAGWATNAGTVQIYEGSPLILQNDDDPGKKMTMGLLSTLKARENSVNIEITSMYGNEPLSIELDQPVYIKSQSTATITHNAIPGDMIYITKPSGEKIEQTQEESDDQIITILPEGLNEEGIWSISIISQTRESGKSTTWQVEESPTSAYSHILELIFQPEDVGVGTLTGLQKIETLHLENQAVLSNFDNWDLAFLEIDSNDQNTIIRIKATSDLGSAEKIAQILAASVMSTAPDLGIPIGFELLNPVSKSSAAAHTWTIEETLSILKNSLKTEIDKGKNPYTAAKTTQAKIIKILPKADASGFLALETSSTKADTINAMRAAEDSARSVYEVNEVPPNSEGKIAEIQPAIPVQDRILEFYQNHTREIQIAIVVLVVIIIIKLKGKGK